jgi:UDP-3-O-[3-hydroxymyristoyl] glucosamine N-acyltransferase
VVPVQRRDQLLIASVGLGDMSEPEFLKPSSLFEIQGAAPSALVHPSARLETGVTIDPAAMIGPRAEIGAGTVIGPMAVIGPDVRIGRDCSIGAGASLINALVGDRVVIQPGCRIGQAGEREDGRRPQPGRVILQDRVEIGANGVIDRGRHHDTVIGEGTVVEALARIPADAMVGRHCTIVAAHDLGHGGETGGPFEDGLRLSAAQVVRQGF